MTRLVLAFMLAMVCQFSLAQSIRGFIRDDVTGEPLVGANIILDDSVAISVSNIDGEYSFDSAEPGRHKITASYVGYKTGVVFDVWVRTGKVISQDILLAQDPKGLAAVVITEPKQLSEIGKMTISEEQINRFAATYYDPARLVTISPDVAVSNDINNRISVRGISPNYNTWRLQEVEIVNPNHLSNAGTFSDQPTSTGGGVNILSAQMLDRSTFLYSDFSAEYGNSIGGLFDMRLKTGNNEERQFTAQASLIGFDFSAEGPFRKDGNGSFILNYRYSFTGLLTSMGVDFGGESIGFQDLSFNVSKPLGDKGSISFFGVGGLNFNNFDAKALEESEVQKDRSDIYFDGKMGAFGFKVNYQLGKGTWMFSTAVSASDNKREQNYYDDNQVLTAENQSSSNTSIYSFNTKYRFKLGKSQAVIGSLFSLYKFDFSNENMGVFMGSSPFVISFADAVQDLEYSLINPYFNISYPFFNFMQFDLGLNYSLSPDNDHKVDPRAKMTIYTSPTSEMYFSVGLYSQLLNPNNYFFVSTLAGGDYYATQREFGFIQSQRYVTGYHVNLGEWSYNAELFYYNFPAVNIDIPGFNEDTEARSYGLSIMGTRSFINDWYLNFGGSLFESTWEEDRPNRYNLNHNVNVSGGKEWIYDGKPFRRSLGINSRIIYQGGLMDPIQENSLMGPPTNSNQDYFRVDLRIQWTRYLANRTTSISLDLQNLTNNQNDGFIYFDSFTGQREPQTQLGLIPILTYRMEF